MWRSKRADASSVLPQLPSNNTERPQNTITNKLCHSIYLHFQSLRHEHCRINIIIILSFIHSLLHHIGSTVKVQEMATYIYTQIKNIKYTQG